MIIPPFIITGRCSSVQVLLSFKSKAKIKFGEPVHSLLAVCNSTIAGNGTLDNGITFGEKAVAPVAEGSLALCLELQDVRYAADLGSLIVVHLLVAGPQVARIVRGPLRSLC
jgi:hypothetical protein